MAQIPFQNFAFTDPVAAQQAVQMGQILANAQAEKDRQFTSFGNELTRNRTAREQNQAAREDAERARIARAAETDKILASQEKVAGLTNTAKTKLNEENDLFNNLSSLIESEDPPTDAEFNEMSKAISEQNKTILKRALEGKRRALNALASEAKTAAEFWNNKFDSVRVGEDDKFKRYKDEFMKDRRANELLMKDPNPSYAFRLLPKYKGPRVSGPTTQAGVPSVPTIDQLRSGILNTRNRLTGPSVPPMMQVPQSSLIGVQSMPAPGYTPEMRAAAFAVPQP